MKTPMFLAFLPLAVLPLLGASPADKTGEKPAPAAATAPLVPAQMLLPVENIVRQLAKGAREREAKDLLKVLQGFEYPAANFEKLEKAVKDDLAKAKTPLDSLPAGAKQLRVTAGQLVPIMEKITDEEQKKDFARKILRLDGECEAAQLALGRVKVGNSWTSADLKPLRERRGEIFQKLEEAKKFPIEMETVEGFDDPYIQQACGTKATVVKRHNLEFRSNFTVERTERLMREFQRAYALSWWLRRGKLEPMPKGQHAMVWVMIDSRELYKKFTTDLKSQGKLDETTIALYEKQDGMVPLYATTDGIVMCFAQWEAATLAKLLVSLTGMPEDIRTPLTAGHLNWIALSCFGTTLPNLVVKEGKDKPGGDTHVEGEAREREELMRLAKAGIAGSRTWMQYLAERDEDPLFGKCLVESIGELQGNELHKATSVVEFFQEASLLQDPKPNMLQELFKKLGKKSEGPSFKKYEAAMGMTFGELETKWREWLLGSRPGVQERIDKENLAAWPRDALRVLEYMNDLREKAFKGKIEGFWKLKFDPDLSGPCDMHANYLALHPEQKKWPDAHEEYADKEGYSVEGAWAGTHSVIAWGGIEDYKESVDLWMGSFYHRLPLLDPGVMRLGWGQADEWWVMDMSSLAAPYDKPYLVHWPYDGQKDVSTYFHGNEYPDPVPEKGVDVVEQELFGYPITIQTNPIDERGETVDIKMRLFEGDKGDKEVECHFSSPSNPSNPESAPAGAWCLIPKKHLKNKTEYRVLAEWHNSNARVTSTAKRLEWTFKTE